MVTVLDKPGRTYTRETFTAPVLIRADGVTLDLCTIDGGYDANYGLRVEYDRKRKRFYRFTQMLGGTITRVVGKGALIAWTALRGVTIEDIGSDGVFIDSGGNVLIEGCNIRDYGWTPGAHADGIQASIGSNIVIRRNEIVNVQGEPLASPLGTHPRASNSCVFLEAQFGNLDRVSIIGNKLDGGLYSLRVRDEEQGYRATKVRVIGNKFLRHYYAPYLFETRENPTLINNDLDDARRARP